MSRGRVYKSKRKIKVSSSKGTAHPVSPIAITYKEPLAVITPLVRVGSRCVPKTLEQIRNERLRKAWAIKVPVYK